MTLSSHYNRRPSGERSNNQGLEVSFCAHRRSEHISTRTWKKEPNRTSWGLCSQAPEAHPSTPQKNLPPVDCDLPNQM